MEQSNQQGEPAPSRRGSRRLRVLFVVSWYPDNAGWDPLMGIFFREHARAAALYDDVAVLVYSQSEERWPRLRWDRAQDDAGFPVFYAHAGGYWLTRLTGAVWQLHLWRAIRRAVREWAMPDVIHTQEVLAYDVVPPSVRLGVPIVISHHCSELFTGRCQPSEVARLRSAFEHARRVLHVYSRGESHYAAHGLKARTRWLPNAVDSTVFYPPGCESRRPWLLHTSGFASEKRFEDVIAAFARTVRSRPHAVLQVVGEGLRRPEMEQAAAKALPGGTWVFHGRLDKPKLAEMMRVCAGFVFPSEFETFGCVLAEAMACGCPVLTTRAGGIPGVVSEGDGILVDVGDIAQISEGMIRLLDGTHGIDMRRVSRETISRFSHQAVGAILHAVHAEVADERSTSVLRSARGEGRDG